MQRTFASFATSAGMALDTMASLPRIRGSHGAEVTSCTAQRAGHMAVRAL